MLALLKVGLVVKRPNNLVSIFEDLDRSSSMVAWSVAQWYPWTVQVSLCEQLVKE